MIRPPPHSIRSPGLSAVLACPFVARFSASPDDAALVRCDDRRSVWTLGRSGGSRLLFVESAIGNPPPGRAERVAVRSEIGGDHVTMVFADAGHGRFVGTRVRRLASGFAVYEEHELPGPVPGAPYTGPARSARTGRARTAGRRQIIAAIERRLPQRADFVETAGPVGRLDRFLRALTHPDDTRLVVDIVDRIVALDRDARSGDWLVGAAEALEWVREAAVACARGLVMDANASRVGHRPEYLSDLRRLVELIDERRHDHPDLCPVRQCVAQRNIFACVRGEVQARKLRRRLEEWVGFGPEEAVGLDTNVVAAGTLPASGAYRGEALPRDETTVRAEAMDHAGPAPRMIATERDDAVDVADSTTVVWVRDRRGGHPEIVEAAATLAGAWRLLADDRMRPDRAPRDEWRRAAAEIDHHAALLRRHFPDPVLALFPNLHGRARPIIIHRAAADA